MTYPWNEDEAPGPTCNLLGRAATDPDDDRNAAVLALVAAGIDGDTLAERVEALLVERDSVGVLNDRLRAELRESEQARAGLAARVRAPETLRALYARAGVQA